LSVSSSSSASSLVKFVWFIQLTPFTHY